MRLLKSKNNAVIALIFRIIGLLVGITAITLQLFTNKLIGKGFMANHVLAYFTIQTNIITTIIFLILIIKTIVQSVKEKKLIVSSINESLHLGCTFYITITMTVYWGVLSFMVGLGKTPLEICNTLFLHLFTPLFAIIDCLLFLNHGKQKKINCIKWLAYPVFYLILIVVIANVSDVPYYKFPMNGNLIPLHYPYPFIDPQVVGTWGMIGVSILLILICIGFGYLYLTIDNKIGKILEKKENIEK